MKDIKCNTCKHKDNRFHAENCVKCAMFGSYKGYEKKKRTSDMPFMFLSVFLQGFIVGSLIRNNNYILAGMGIISIILICAIVYKKAAEK